jgi:hypothetical protein
MFQEFTPYFATEETRSNTLKGLVDKDHKIRREE